MKKNNSKIQTRLIVGCYLLLCSTLAIAIPASYKSPLQTKNHGDTVVNNNSDKQDKGLQATKKTDKNSHFSSPLLEETEDCVYPPEETPSRKMILERKIYGLATHFWWVYNYECLGFDRQQQFVNEYLDLGANVTRFGISWQDIDPDGDGENFDFLVSDALVNTFYNSGIEIIGLFDQVPIKFQGEHYEDIDSVAKEPLFVFAKALAAHYADKINYWEFWNEPGIKGISSYLGVPETYASWFDIFQRGILAGNANARVGMGTPVTPDDESPESSTIEFIERVLTELYCNYYTFPNAIVLHPYMNDGINKFQIETIHEKYEDMPIWITEYGWKGIDDETRAARINSTFDYLEDSEQDYIQFATMHMLHDYFSEDDDNREECLFSNDNEPDSNQGEFGLVSKGIYEDTIIQRKCIPWEAFQDHAGGERVCVSDPESEPSDLKEPKGTSGSFFSVYPNPVKSNLFIETNIEVIVSVCNLLGKVLIVKQINSSGYISLSELSKGIYTVKIESKQRCESFCIIKE